MRTCDNPAPSGGGSTCAGRRSRYVPCSKPLCDGSDSSPTTSAETVKSSVFTIILTVGVVSGCLIPAAIVVCIMMRRLKARAGWAQSNKGEIKAISLLPTPQVPHRKGTSMLPAPADAPVKARSPVIARKPSGKPSQKPTLSSSDIDTVTYWLQGSDAHKSPMDTSFDSFNETGVEPLEERAI